MKNRMNINKQNYHCMKDTLIKMVVGFIFLFFLTAGGVTCVSGESKKCGAFFLRNSDGDIINPLTGKNGDQPFSTRKTCGACHDYELITKGYHFQQGWDCISDTFNEKMPWVLSNGMMGKH